MNLVRTSERQPSERGTYWIVAGYEGSTEKSVALWDGSEWKYSEAAADHLWDTKYSEPVLAWVDPKCADATVSWVEG